MYITWLIIEHPREWLASLADNHNKILLAGFLTKFVSIGSYLPEVRTFGTFITSTKVFSLILYCEL